MKKILLTATALAAFTATAAASTASAAWYTTDFHSWHKPVSARMADRSEMLAYRADLAKYIADTNRTIAEIRKKQAQAMAQYNAAAHEYNNESFFHQDKVPTFKKKEQLKGDLELAKTAIVLINYKDEDE